MRALLDRLVSALARLMLRVFFRDVEVAGAGLIPRGAPLLIVANHVNSVVDPLLLLAFVDGRARMLAKSTLWSHPVMGPLLVLAGALPVYRRQDAGEDVTRNFATFARCHEALAAGGSVALFPEGRSHNNPHGLPLKTGAARIALETEARHGPVGLRILPVGLVYEAKDRFRSRVLVNVGPFLDPAPEVAQLAAGGRAAVRTLTRRLALSLEALTASYATWEEARLASLAASVAGGGSMLARLDRSRALLAAYRALREERPERVRGFAEGLRAYDRRLRDLDLADDDVASAADKDAVLASLPLGVPGTLLNVIPYRLTGWVTRRFARRPDEPATYMLLTALLVFPAAWLATAAAVGLAFGSLWGVAVGFLAPATGPRALRLREALLARARCRRAQPLRAMREALLAEMLRIAAETSGRSGSGC